MSLPSGVKESKCKSCGAAIIWASTRKEKAMPVDAAPNPAGDFVTFLRGGKVMVEKWEWRRHANVPKRTSHFATCPNAKEHRR